MVLIFHHTDLDGIGVKIIGIKRAQALNEPYKTYSCNYHEINQAVADALKVFSPEEITEILIGDISVNTEVAKMLDAYYKAGIEVILRDHHLSAEWLNKYPWAYVAEAENDTARCGTYLLAKCFPAIYADMETFIDTVDSWDTWKWKATSNTYARDLNALLQMMGEEEFTKYIIELYDNQHQKIVTSYQLFTADAQLRVKFRNEIIESTAKKCESSMWVSDCNVKSFKLKCGIIFCNTSISSIADCVLDMHPELDFLAIIAMPRNISLRTQKNLPIPLSEIANKFTGSGGGHPHSAGAVINTHQFKKIFNSMTEILNDSGITWENLHLNQED